MSSFTEAHQLLNLKCFYTTLPEFSRCSVVAVPVDWDSDPADPGNPA